MYRELLRLAGTLAAESGGRPRWVSRSRAVSTAYYALFHALAEGCARELIGAWRPWEPFRHVYRSLDHAQARRVLNLVQRDAAFGVDARRLAEAFLDLQGQRHSADYDPGYRVSPVEMADILVQAERATELVFQLSRSERKPLAARLIGRTRG